MQAGPRKKLPTDIIEMTCELSADEAWADLQRAGMSTAVLLKQYYAQNVNDRPLGLHIIELKQAEHAGWVALASPDSFHFFGIHIDSRDHLCIGFWPRVL